LPSEASPRARAARPLVLFLSSCSSRLILRAATRSLLPFVLFLSAHPACGHAKPVAFRLVPLGSSCVQPREACCLSSCSSRLILRAATRSLLPFVLFLSAHPACGHAKPVACRLVPLGSSCVRPREPRPYVLPPSRVLFDSPPLVTSLRAAPEPRASAPAVSLFSPILLDHVDAPTGLSGPLLDAVPAARCHAPERNAPALRKSGQPILWAAGLACVYGASAGALSSVALLILWFAWSTLSKYPGGHTRRAAFARAWGTCVVRSEGGRRGTRDEGGVRSGLCVAGGDTPLRQPRHCPSRSHAIVQRRALVSLPRGLCQSSDRRQRSIAFRCLAARPRGGSS
jgi:hypothetical protein